jgi:segregation and condensation protein B
MSKKNKQKKSKAQNVENDISNDVANETANENTSENAELAGQDQAEVKIQASAQATPASLAAHALSMFQNFELADFSADPIFIEDEASESFLPEVSDEEVHQLEQAVEIQQEQEEQLEELAAEVAEAIEGTELDQFESAQIEDVEFIEEERVDSIIESILFASDRPVSLNSIKMVFKGTNVGADKIKRSIERIAVELAGARRGVSLEDAPGGYQLRTKIDNMNFLTRTLKARPFRLSGPALEVLAIVAYKQPLIKSEIDDIRGVESGHLLRALMEKGLVNFEGKSDLPGKPMQYGSTKKFLEIFGLRNLKELPTLSQIDELLPEGMTEEEAKPTLGQVADSLSQTIGSSYSEGEDELTKISDQLDHINTSSDFFEQEKLRQKQKRDADKAQNIREAIAMGEEVANRDRSWLTRYDEALVAGETVKFAQAEQAQEKQEQQVAEAQVLADAESESESFADDETHALDADLAVELADEDEDDQGEEPHGDLLV